MSRVLNPGIENRLSDFALLIHKWNSAINLTGYKSVESIRKNLIDESVEAFFALQLSAEMVVDFGSGAGIPGLVWACMDSDVQITSVEIRQKKVAFQKEILRKLSIHAEIVCGRFPEALQDRNFDLIVSRAIRFDPRLWSEGERLLKPGGKFVRFAPPEAAESGWEQIPVTPQTSLLVRSV